MNKLVGLMSVGLLGVASVANAQSLTTLFAQNNQFAGNMFDLTNLTSGDLTITAVDVNVTLAGTQQNISVFYRTDSFINATASTTGWIDAGTYNVTSAGDNAPTNVPLTGGIVIPAGAQYGMYVYVTDYVVNPAPAGVASMLYTNVPPALPQYANSDLQFDGGIGKGSPPFTGGVFSPRIWNGTIHYTLGGAGCYADCDMSGSLDFFDFLCFQNEFAAGSSYADCDQSGSLDFFDFLCFQNEFAAGCP